MSPFLFLRTKTTYLEYDVEVELRECDVGVDGAAVLAPREAQLRGGVAEALVLDLAALQGGDSTALKTDCKSARNIIYV